MLKPEVLSVQRSCADDEPVVFKWSWVGVSARLGLWLLAGISLVPAVGRAASGPDVRAIVAPVIMERLRPYVARYLELSGRHGVTMANERVPMRQATAEFRRLYGIPEGAPLTSCAAGEAVGASEQAYYGEFLKGEHPGFRPGTSLDISER